MKRWTWLAALNYVVVQWFGARLARVEDDATGRVTGWALLVGVVPLTGWTTPYRYVGRAARVVTLWQAA